MHLDQHAPPDQLDTDPLAVQALLAALPARIDAIPRSVAARTPYAPALRENGRTLTYAALVARIDADAALLREHGVRPGDRVLLVSENCIAQVALIFAASTLGAWIVNLNPRLSAAEVDGIQAHCGARLALYTAAVSAEAAAHAARAGAQAHDALMIGPLNEGCLPEPADSDAGTDTVAALIYTTGTTGQPKGVMLGHRNLLFVAAVSSRLRGLVPADRAWGVLPISHVYGLTSVLLGTLYAGACLQLAARFTPEAMLAAIRDDGLSIVQGVPAMYARLLELAASTALPVPMPSTLRFAYAGGSPLDPALKRRVEALLGLPLHNGYGLTEAAPTVSQTRLDAPRADTAVGQPIPGVALRIVDQAGREVAAGTAGELWVRGPNVMRGYYREAALSAAALAPGGWLNTGDMARRDPDGALFIVGRKKELIIRSGFNVFPLEVETVLNAHPGVLQSAVVGKAAPDGNEEVVAFVQPAGGPAPTPTPTPEQLQAFAAECLAPYKRPTRIVFMQALPAAATGKILKHLLKEMAASMPR